jgi:hypothetical protein
MRIAAIDQSLTSTGFAVWNSGDDLPRSGAWPLCDGVWQRASAFVGLHRELAALQAEGAIDLLAYETPVLMPTDKRDKLVGLYGMVAHLESYCHVKRIRIVSVGQASWRATWFNGMAITGRENLKRAAIERARQFEMDPLTDDEAEACGILDHIMHVEKITPPWRLANPLVAAV